MNKQKNTFNKFLSIQKSSDQWKIIQFRLQLTLGTTAANITRLHNISSNQLSSVFSNYAKGKTVLQSFIETQKLVDQNNLFKISQKGFDIDEFGMVFDVGYNRKIDLKTPKQFSFVSCKIAVGRSYCYTQKKYKNQPKQLPDGFQSIYLYSDQQNPQVFIHKYVLFNSQQVFPCYLVDFTIDPLKQKQLRQPLCDNCVKSTPNPAKFYCNTQQAYFCTDCQLQYHSLKLQIKHDRVQIIDKPKKFGQCPRHPDEKLQLYCHQCSDALCSICKVTGDHSSSQMGKHLLMKLKDAYTDISSKVKQIDPNIQRKKNQLIEDLNRIDLKIKQINGNATVVQQQIYAHFYKALQQLQNQTKKKLSFLIGQQLQLKRQFDHIQWMESFLKYSMEIQQPHQFLHTWNKYCKYKNQMLSVAKIHINNDVKADIKLQGSLAVIVESSKKKDGASVQQTVPQQPNNALQTIRQQISSVQAKKLSITDSHDFTSTSLLKKTIFKKHYAVRQKFGQPAMMKGNVDGKDPFPV